MASFSSSIEIIYTSQKSYNLIGIFLMETSLFLQLSNYQQNIKMTTITHVAHLIDQDTESWDTAIVKANFLPFEAETILGIPLCTTRNKDMLIWGGLDEKQREAPGSSDAAPRT